MCIENNLYDIKKIKKTLEKNLEEKRYEHTIGVADTAACLAMKYGYNVEKAYVAGLLHDCAKCIDNEKKLQLCKKYKVKLSKVEIENPFLIHAKLGAALAKEKYGIDDEEILDSIRFHTTGKENMTLLEKIIFSADYIEPNRKMILGLQEIRNTIFDDFDRAIYIILENTIKHLNNKKQIIDDTSMRAYEYYKDLVNYRNN